MSDLTRELSLDELPRPPLYRLVDEEGRDVFQETEVGGAPATVGVLFAEQLGHGGMRERGDAALRWDVRQTIPAALCTL